MIRAEAEEALAEYEAQLVMGEPEENHQRLASVVRSYLKRGPVTGDEVDAAADVLDERVGGPLSVPHVAQSIARAALEAAGAAR